jgi:hypothetical protein
MPQPGAALEKLRFSTIGLFDGGNPGPGHQTTLEMITLGTRLESPSQVKHGERGTRRNDGRLPSHGEHRLQ